MIRKAHHHDHNTGMPSTDVAEFTDDLTGFVTGVAGRDPAYANTIAGALLPDMLVTYPRRDNVNPSNSGVLVELGVRRVRRPKLDR